MQFIHRELIDISYFVRTKGIGDWSVTVCHLKNDFDAAPKVNILLVHLVLTFCNLANTLINNVSLSY